MATTISQTGANLTALGVVTLKIFISHPLQIGINVHNYRYSKTAGTIMTAGEVAQAFYDHMSSSMAAVTNNACKFLGVKCELTEPLPVGLPGIAIGTEVGIGTGDVLPTQTAGMISWKTALAGPGNRGRNYIPFPSESDNDPDGTPNASYLGKLTTLHADVSAFQTVVGGTATYSFTHVIWRRGPRTAIDVTQGQRRDAWGTQRKRGSYGRVNAPVIS